MKKIIITLLAILFTFTLIAQERKLSDYEKYRLQKDREEHQTLYAEDSIKTDKMIVDEKSEPQIINNYFYDYNQPNVHFFSNFGYLWHPYYYNNWYWYGWNYDPFYYDWYWYQNTYYGWYYRPYWHHNHNNSWHYRYFTLYRYNNTYNYYSQRNHQVRTYNSRQNIVRNEPRQDVRTTRPQDKPTYSESRRTYNPTYSAPRMTTRPSYNSSRSSNTRATTSTQTQTRTNTQVDRPIYTRPNVNTGTNGRPAYNSPSNQSRSTYSTPSRSSSSRSSSYSRPTTQPSRSYSTPSRSSSSATRSSGSRR